MKKLLLLFICLISFNKTNGQVVFCPPGAEWHYLFSGTIFWPGTTYNEQIKYAGDSIDGPDTLKILIHRRFFMTCDRPVMKTLIKQKADTVFFKNLVTQDTWQILYNFAAQPGQSWQTTVKSNSVVTFSFTVQSVNTITVNGFPLKQLSVTSSRWGGSLITERFGSDWFLFNYSIKSPGICDGDVFMEYLCYQDSSFGLKQFSDKSCDYYTSNGVGVDEEKINARGIKIFPNPAKDLINLEFENTYSSVSTRLSNITGQVIINFENLTDSKVQLNLKNLERGIYFLQVFEKEKLVFTQKIIKE